MRQKTVITDACGRGFNGAAIIAQFRREFHISCRRSPRACLCDILLEFIDVYCTRRLKFNCHNINYTSNMHVTLFFIYKAFKFTSIHDCLFLCSIPPVYTTCTNISNVLPKNVSNFLVKTFTVDAR